MSAKSSWKLVFPCMRERILRSVFDYMIMHDFAG